MTQDELRTRARQLRKEGAYESAVPLFRQLWNRDEPDPWDGWGLAFCLRRLGEPREAARVCKAIEAVNADIARHDGNEEVGEEQLRQMIEAMLAE